MRLPTLKAIMAEHRCDINAARSIRARMEVEADRAHFRKTGKHTLDVVSADVRGRLEASRDKWTKA